MINTCNKKDNHLLNSINTLYIIKENKSIFTIGYKYTTLLVFTKNHLCI